MSQKIFSLAILLGMMLIPSTAWGQGRGNFDPAQMRNALMSNIREQLDATDNEWKLMSPRVEKVLLAQRDAQVGRQGRRGADPQAQTPLTIAQQELRAALDRKDMPPEGFERKLAALREARDKAMAELKEAQTRLKELLSIRQEAVLVDMGLLD